mmetsp:Transcript_29236/g.48322  ORF Transcript_29236/g.48322 Transcript_29236/m.48322 type:complete len:316 (+) Transcript_29236:137-1084(+)
MNGTRDDPSLSQERRMFQFKHSHVAAEGLCCSPAAPLARFAATLPCRPRRQIPLWVIVPVVDGEGVALLHLLLPRVPRADQVFVGHPRPDPEVVLRPHRSGVNVLRPPARVGHVHKVVVEPLPHPAQDVIVHDVHQVVLLAGVDREVEDIPPVRPVGVGGVAALAAELPVGPPAQLVLAVDELEVAHAQGGPERVHPPHALPGVAHLQLVDHLGAGARRGALVRRHDAVPVVHAVQRPQVPVPADGALQDRGQPVHVVHHAVQGGPLDVFWEQRRVHKGVHPQAALEQGVLFAAQRVIAACVVGAAPVVRGHDDD